MQITLQMDTSNKGCFHAKMDSRPLISIVMTHDSILMILIEDFNYSDFVPPNCIKSNVAHCSAQFLLRPRVTDNHLFEATSTVTKLSPQLKHYLLCE